MTKKLTGRGGPDRGQGRKEGSPNKKPKKPQKRGFSFRAGEELAAWIDSEASKAGLKPSPFLERWIEEARTQKG